ncbi:MULTISPECIES: hypothetical protein [Pseudovibrio]|uniref:hypothetical protein n=1 Tax=Stappiaceae TaxID=2821832 RepID=UPI0023658F50|nr:MULTISPECIES: hypothetical protein [Pseudovibrio]MDD7909924.1 hypothetical protein [Pseudovibrio exalbescens]MDX5592261.1 hypothetical protein [Pseudovibrio sp. SPO723]
MAFATGLKPPSALEQPSGAPLPSLTGFWTAVKLEALYWHRDQTNEETAHFSLEIEEQNGALLEGMVHWDNDATKGPGHDGSSETRKARQPFIGVLGYDGRSLTLVQHPDSGRLEGRFLNADSLELVYSEAGRHAVVARYLLVRQASLKGQ